jgi:Zn-dependent protease with chaperone function
MLKRKSVAVLLIVYLALAQSACRGLLGDRSGESGGTEVSSGARPAPHFKPGFNLFTPQQDIELGRRSAQQITQQVPLLNDERTVNYVRQLGAKLTANAPGFAYTYQFAVVATKDINAFALPGGYVFVNAGTIAAAKNEGELAGVMAHEISHVALRHGTNQASKAYLAERGLNILRSIAGGQDHPNMDQIITSIGGTGANMLFLKFGRTAESQADLEGAHIMARSGYDPRDMVNFFKTLEEKGGQRAPEMLSDHPDPGNRAAALDKALPTLGVSSHPVHNSDEFTQVKARLTGASSSSLGQPERPARVGPRDPNDIKPGTTPDGASGSFRQFQARDGSFAIQYPENWDALTADDANMIFAPKGAYGQVDQSIVVTHGIFIGAVAPESGDLEKANAAFVRQQVEINPDFRVVRQPQQINFGGRAGLATVVAGPSTVTGVLEVDVIYTTATSDGRLFYLITMAPEDELKNYQPTFEKIMASLRLKG